MVIVERADEEEQRAAAIKRQVTISARHSPAASDEVGALLQNVSCYKRAMRMGYRSSIGLERNHKVSFFRGSRPACRNGRSIGTPRPL
jgi:hypothetical protein